MPDEAISASSARKCPICGKAAKHEDRPFCSARCKEVDLHRWLAGTYAIPAGDDDETVTDGAPILSDDV